MRSEVPQFPTGLRAKLLLIMLITTTQHFSEELFIFKGTPGCCIPVDMKGPGVAELQSEVRGAPALWGPLLTPAWALLAWWSMPMLRVLEKDLKTGEHTNLSIWASFL